MREDSPCAVNGDVATPQINRSSPASAARCRSRMDFVHAAFLASCLIAGGAVRPHTDTSYPPTYHHSLSDSVAPTPVAMGVDLSRAEPPHSD